MTVILLAVAGGLGAVTRHLTTTAVQRVWNRSWPSGTVIVNLAGSVVAGFVSGRSGSASASLGFLAGFTTYSAWMVESVWLWSSGPGGHGRALLDVVGTLLAGVFLVWLGSSVGARL